MAKYSKSIFVTSILFTLAFVSLVGFCENITADYDDQDRVLRYGNIQYEYTPNGERSKKITSNGVTTYTYDGLGNLTKVVLGDGNTIEYVIDGANRRVGKKVNGILVQGFLYEPDGIRPIAELDGNNNVTTRFVYGVNPMVPEYMVKNGVTR